MVQYLNLTTPSNPCLCVSSKQVKSSDRSLFHYDKDDYIEIFIIIVLLLFYVIEDRERKKTICHF